jgi:hypothetical protein
MTYSILKTIINQAYANFSDNYITNEILGVDDEYSNRRICFVKAIWKVLLNQYGDETIDMLTKTNIQQCIVLFNKYSNSTVQIEYT